VILGSDRACSPVEPAPSAQKFFILIDDITGLEELKGSLRQRRVRIGALTAPRRSFTLGCDQ